MQIEGRKGERESKLMAKRVESMPHHKNQMKWNEKNRCACRWWFISVFALVGLFVCLLRCASIACVPKQQISKDESKIIAQRMANKENNEQHEYIKYYHD